MIRSWKDASTRRFAETGKSRWRGLDADVAQERLQALHAAKSLEGLGRRRSLGWLKLRGNRAGAWAMTINGSWRLVFRCKDGDAHDVERVDDHQRSKPVLRHGRVRPCPGSCRRRAAQPRRRALNQPACRQS